MARPSYTESRRYGYGAKAKISRGIDSPVCTADLRTRRKDLTHSLGSWWTLFNKSRTFIFFVIMCPGDKDIPKHLVIRPLSFSSPGRIMRQAHILFSRYSSRQETSLDDQDQYSMDSSNNPLSCSLSVSKSLAKLGDSINTLSCGIVPSTKPSMWSAPKPSCFKPAG